MILRGAGITLCNCVISISGVGFTVYGITHKKSGDYRMSYKRRRDYHVLHKRGVDYIVLYRKGRDYHVLQLGLPPIV